jgi:hypothetical protein
MHKTRSPRFVHELLEQVICYEIRVARRAQSSHQCRMDL